MKLATVAITDGDVKLLQQAIDTIIDSVEYEQDYTIQNLVTSLGKLKNDFNQELIGAKNVR